MITAPGNLGTVSKVTQQAIKAGWTRLTLNPKPRLDGHSAIESGALCCGSQQGCVHTMRLGLGEGSKGASFMIWAV